MANETTEQKWLLLLICSVTAISGLLFGYDTGSISGAILYIKKQYTLTTGQEELIISMVACGAIFGGLIGGRISDRFGRKKIILFSSALFIITSLGLAFATSVWQMIGYRFFIGVGIGASIATVPLYIAELVPSAVRGALVSVNQLAITVGILASYLIGFAFVKTMDWRMIFAIGAIPAAIQLVVLSFFPESPRHLMKVGKKSQALKILQKYRGSKKEAQLEITQIEHLHNIKTASWKEFLGKQMRPLLLAGIGISIIQQVTGINTIIYYAPTIFKLSGFSSDGAALFASVGVGTVNVLMTIVAIYLIDKIGRKPLLYIGLGSMIVSLVVLGLAFITASTEWVALISLITLFVYIGAFAISLGPIAWLLNSEIYPLHIRGRAMGIASSANWLFNFIITATFLNLINLLGTSGTFWLYGLIGIFGLLFIWRWVPETKGKSLEEIEELLA